MEIHYIKLPLDTIPFKEIPSLEGFEYKYVYCSYFSLSEFMKMETCLFSVYNCFDTVDEDRIESEVGELLFGRVISEPPPKRGPGKVIKVKSIERDVKKQSLPHLKYSNNNLPDGNWFYMKEGNYFVFSAIKSSFEKVNHLEGHAIYGDITLRLRIVVELLKRNIKQGVINLTGSEFKEIAFKVLRLEPSTKKLSDKDIYSGVENWLKSMLITPIYNAIPMEYLEHKIS